MKYKRNELEKISAWRSIYIQPRYRIKIMMKDGTSYIGLIEDVEESNVEEDTRELNRTSFHSLPVKFYFTIKDIASSDNGKQVEIDVFSISNIEWFDKPELVYVG